MSPTYALDFLAGALWPEPSGPPSGPVTEESRDQDEGGLCTHAGDMLRYSGLLLWGSHDAGRQQEVLLVHCVATSAVRWCMLSAPPMATHAEAATQ